MSVLRQAGISALLTGAALAAGCSSENNEKEKLHGMTYAIQGLCVTSATEKQKWACVDVAADQALFLVNHLKAQDEFKKACDFRPNEEGLPADMMARLAASQVSRCLNVIDIKGSDEVKTVTAQIRLGLQRGLE